MSVQPMLAVGNLPPTYKKRFTGLKLLLLGILLWGYPGCARKPAPAPAPAPSFSEIPFGEIPQEKK